MHDPRRQLVARAAAARGVGSRGSSGTAAEVVLGQPARVAASPPPPRCAARCRRARRRPAPGGGPRGRTPRAPVAHGRQRLQRLRPPSAGTPPARPRRRRCPRSPRRPGRSRTTPRRARTPCSPPRVNRTRRITAARTPGRARARWPRRAAGSPAGRTRSGAWMSSSASAKPLTIVVIPLAASSATIGIEPPERTNAGSMPVAAVDRPVREAHGLGVDAGRAPARRARARCRPRRPRARRRAAAARAPGAMSSERCPGASRHARRSPRAVAGTIVRGSPPTMLVDLERGVGAVALVVARRPRRARPGARRPRRCTSSPGAAAPTTRARRRRRASTPARSSSRRTPVRARHDRARASPCSTCAALSTLPPYMPECRSRRPVRTAICGHDHAAQPDGDRGRPLVGHAGVEDDRATSAPCSSSAQPLGDRLAARLLLALHDARAR